MKDEGVCVRHWDWSETSQTVSIFTREHGVLRGLAKGAKREHSQFSGGIELATRGEVVAIVKQAEADHALATLTAWDLLETFPGTRRSLSGFLVSMAMLDFVHHGLEERDPHPGVYDALVIGLRRVEREGEALHAAAVFAWAILEGTGHRPELFEDVGGSGRLPDAVLFGFDPRRGAVVADPGDSAAAPGGGTVWRVRGETVDVLRHLSRGSALDQGAFPPESVERALKLLCYYFRELVGVQGPAIRAMLEGVTTGRRG
jgi:DNA repair protein RecO